MSPAVGGHPGFAAVRLDNPKRGFPLTVVRILCLHMCVRLRARGEALRGLLLLLLEEMVSAPSAERACAEEQHGHGASGLRAQPCGQQVRLATDGRLVTVGACLPASNRVQPYIYIIVQDGYIVIIQSALFKPDCHTGVFD